EPRRKFEGNLFIILEIGQFKPCQVHHSNTLLQEAQSYEKKKARTSAGGAMPEHRKAPVFFALLFFNNARNTTFAKLFFDL
ncbi:MAG: hypothetical protein WBL00_01050, partial [Bacteroidales bacterium]